MKRSFSGTAQETRDEHARLHELLERARRDLEARRGQPALAAALTRDIARRVLEHFEHEEQGGYFAEALRAAPHFAHRAEALQAQHASLAALVDALREQAASGVDFEHPGAAEHWWRQLDEKFARFYHEFLAHEAAENLLLMECHGDDIGTKD